MKIHVHNWVLNGKWRCIAPNHVHEKPDILDANTVWHVLGVIKTHTLQHDNLLDESVCICGWEGSDYMEHLDDAVFYWLRSIDPQI